MSYIAKFLAPEETIRKRARLHWILWVRAWAALIFLGIFLVGIIIFVQQVIFNLTTELAATDRRLILKKGWIMRHAVDVGLSNIESVQITQDVMGRIFNYGRLMVHGTGDEAWETPIIADPAGFRRDIQAATPRRGH
jgi:uncharacterized membrane protein YdbT with pleckstrin-like domain